MCVSGFFSLLVFFCLFFFFFFSSRRRHTRLVSDWSSDVCSSDLVIGHLGQVLARPLEHERLVGPWQGAEPQVRSEEHTSELQSLTNLVCRLLLEKKKKKRKKLKKKANTICNRITTA